MREATENLYIGGLRSPKKAGDDVDRIVSLHLEMEQTTHPHPIMDGEHDYETFKNAVEDTVEGLENDETVLVNCQRGSSRSVSVATVALHETTERSVYEALEVCKLSDDEVPNNHLMESILRYQDEE